MANGQRTFSERIPRILRHYLIIPLYRSRHSPEYTARGVMVGLVVAFTPTVGIQMPFIAIAWAAARAAHRNWDFSLIAAMAWTWVTNFFTVGPIYYAFLVTGRLLLGEEGPIPGYEMFSARVTNAVGQDSGWIETTLVRIIELVELYGLPLFVGCLPWAIVIGTVGYFWSLSFVRRYRRAREERRHRRHRRLRSKPPA